ncbi:hypothetical protein Tco_0584766, partial [Tanacetum coccineum]
VDEEPRRDDECKYQGEEDSTNSTNRVNTISFNVNAASSNKVNTVGTNIRIDLPDDLNMPELEEIGTYKDETDDEEVGAEAEIHNLESTFHV